MSGQVLLRLIWKEYRLQRGFWISMALLAAVLQVALLLGNRIMGLPPLPITALYGVAFVGAALYALGCGATLFATELEAETYTFQRSLPVSPLGFFFGKLTFAVISTLLLALLMWCWTVLPAEATWPELSSSALLWAEGLTVSAEFLAWGIFYSLLTSKPLKAAGLAAATSVVFLVFHEQQEGAQTFLVLWRLLVVTAIFAADVWLGHRWFAERMLPKLFGSSTMGQSAVGTGGAELPSRRHWLSGFSRLLWQELRRSLALCSASAVLLVVLVLVLLATIDSAHGRAAEVLPLFIVIMVSAGSSFGTCVFFADQRGASFRFLAERAVQPRVVWAARHLFWFIGFVLWVGLYLTIAWLHSLPQELSKGALVLLLGSLIGYASGQLCSMLIRSSLVAAAAGVMLTLLLLAWALLMYYLQVNLWWSAAPIPIVLLWATWLRAPDWMWERSRWPARLRAAASLLLPAASFFTFVPLYRVYEIPAVTPGFSPLEFQQSMTEEDRETARLLERAAELLRMPSPRSIEDSDGGSEQLGFGVIELAGYGIEELDDEVTARDIEWLEANREALELALQASRRAGCALEGHPMSVNISRRLTSVIDLVLTRALDFQENGQLDDALEHYLAALRLGGHLRDHNFSNFFHGISLEIAVHHYLAQWSAQPGQTVARLAAAHQQLEAIYAGSPDPSDAIKQHYVLVRQVLEGETEQLPGDVVPDTVSAVAWVPYVAPWELARARRQLDISAAEALQKLAQIRDNLRRGEAFNNADLLHYLNNEYFTTSESDAHVVLPSDVIDGQAIGRFVANLETRRRATEIILALQAWRIEHRSLPSALEELVDTHLDRVPIDPFTGDPFHYFREGLPYELTTGPVAPHQPLLWSGGSAVFVNQEETTILGRYRLWKSVGILRRPTSEEELWEAGWPIPIPLPETE